MCPPACPAPGLQEEHMMADRRHRQAVGALAAQLVDRLVVNGAEAAAAAAAAAAGIKGLARPSGPSPM